MVSNLQNHCRNSTKNSHSPSHTFTNSQWIFSCPVSLFFFGKQAQYYHLANSLCSDFASRPSDVPMSFLALQDHMLPSVVMWLQSSLIRMLPQPSFAFDVIDFLTIRGHMFCRTYPSFYSADVP